MFALGSHITHRVEFKPNSMTISTIRVVAQSADNIRFTSSKETKIDRSIIEPWHCKLDNINKPCVFILSIYSMDDCTAPCTRYSRNPKRLEKGNGDVGLKGTPKRVDAPTASA